MGKIIYMGWVKRRTLAHFTRADGSSLCSKKRSTSNIPGHSTTTSTELAIRSSRLSIKAGRCASHAIHTSTARKLHGSNERWRRDRCVEKKPMDKTKLNMYIDTIIRLEN